jgi:hypothetical protein
LVIKGSRTWRRSLVGQGHSDRVIIGVFISLFETAALSA